MLLNITFMGLWLNTPSAIHNSAKNMLPENTQNKLKALLEQLNRVIVGKPEQVQDCVACLLAGGHLLIEDVPGVGKTTLAHALAATFGLVVLPKSL